MNQKRIEIFLNKFPLFTSTVSKLDENKIDWMISGSGCFFLLGSERVPDDVDIFLRNDQHAVADLLFNIKSYFYTSETEKVRNSNPEGDHSIQLTSDLKITLDEKTYDFSITSTVLSKRVKLEAQDRDFWLLPPEEVLLVKAILQRGPDVGKHDIEDIKQFMKIYSIDYDYLQQRIKSIDAAERVGDIFTP